MSLKPSEATFRPDIEGLRAIAILLVVGYHAAIPFFDGGFVGVDVFFVLSGYLITGLLVREIESTGTLDLPRFYARRARRLLPALTLLLLVTIVISVAVHSPGEQRGFTTSAASTAVYVSNLYFAKAGTIYGANSANNNPLQHTWSLSVEEQFYLVWPVFVMFALSALSWQKRTNSGRRRLLIWMGAVTAISFALSYYLTGVVQPWAFFSSPTRAWEFALGAVAVLLPQKRTASSADNEKRHPVAQYALTFSGWLALGGIFAAVLFYDNKTLYPGIAAVLPVVCTVAILRASSSSADNALVRMLSIRPLQEIGRLSYSWYLWHWPVLVFGYVIIFKSSIPVRLGLVALSLLLAAASYRFVENPIRYNRSLASRNAYSLAMAGALAIVGIGMSFAWRMASSSWMYGSPVQVRAMNAHDDQPRGEDIGRCMAPYEKVKVESCTFGAKNSSVIVVLLGDSHAFQWVSVLDSISSQNGWRLLTMSKSACALVEAPLIYPGLGRTYTECAQWRKSALRQIRQIRPALTVMTSVSNYDFQDAERRDGISFVVNDLSEASQRVLILKDTPKPPFDVPACLARREWRLSIIPSPSCRFVPDSAFETKVYEIQEMAARRHSNVLAADVSYSLCPHDICAGEIGETIIYRDNSHLTVSGAFTLENELSRQIDKVMSGEHTE